MAKKEPNFTDIAWPASRLGELVENLAQKAKMLKHSDRLPQPPERLQRSDYEDLGRWLDNAAATLGLEAEPVSTLYTDVDQFIRVGGPSILRFPASAEDDQLKFLALIKGSKHRGYLLCPDLKVRKLHIEALRSVICQTYEAQITKLIDQVLVEVEVIEQRRERVKAAILKNQLGPVRIESGWLLRLPPSAGTRSQFRYSGIYRPVLILLGMYAIQQLLSIASWIVIGRGVFQGHFDMGWILAWSLLLLFTIPVQIIVNDGQNELSTNAGSIFKQRLIHGTLQLEPEEIRHQGMGQFLGRVMESEAVEMLALSGGFMAILSIVDLFFAFLILTKGVGGNLHAFLLALWVISTILILWRYYQNSRDWFENYRGMTNDLVEGMVGHRTRLIQEDIKHWHDNEDQSLDKYLKLSENVDQISIQLNAFISRGWMIVGLIGIAIPFATESPPPQMLAISLGGVLLASQALAKLTGGAQSLMGLFNAWQQVGPLFNAAARPKSLSDLSLVDTSSTENHSQENHIQYPHRGEIRRGETLLAGRELFFRYRPLGKAVLEGCTIQINQGDRILLEGPSGGGKSTLAAILTGLRFSEAGSLLLWGIDQKILGTDEWRRKVTMAPQFHENYVFSETFAFNLLMGRRWPPEPGDLEEAEQLCRELGLGEVLDRMPSGFQQMLGESGWQLSHGERSRLYIARTLLQKSDLIILDESFGSLDPENLFRSLKCVLDRARTVLVIAHP